MMTHSNEIAIEASYLYCYAIGLLINGAKPIDAFNMTKEEVKSSAIKGWFENEIDAADTSYLIPA